MKCQIENESRTLARL